MEHIISSILRAVIAYDAGDARRIHHLLKVHSFARLIGVGEGLDQDTQFILEAAAAVHDIGIHKAEQVYGSCKGPYQEELGPAEAEALLTPLGVSGAALDRILYLVGHHHTYTGIDGVDYQILVEADFLVNIHEGNVTTEAARHAYQRIFRTETGKQLYRDVYPTLCG